MPALLVCSFAPGYACKFTGLPRVRTSALTLINDKTRSINLHANATQIVLKKNTMKLYALLLGVFLFSKESISQVKEGKIVYERTMTLQIRIADDNPAMQEIPRLRKDKFELLFANGKSLWRAAEPESEAEQSWVNNDGAQIRIMVPGSNDVIYNDFPQQVKVEQRELGTKQFVIQDSIRRFKWKIGNETKNILGYACKRATSERTQENFRVEMDNGVMKRTPFTDTLVVVAWFTDAIPSFAGPDIYQGQVPGTILEIDINNGRTSYLAQEITAKADLKEIKEPKGKKITAEEFAKERDKMMKEMEENSGGNFQMRIRN